MATGTAVQVNQATESFTYADYRGWPDGERWELIDGQAYDMCPAPARVHQDVVLELGRQVANFLLGQPCRPYVAPFDVRLPEADEPDDAIKNVVQPDLAVICDPRKLDDKGCRGAPDWIMEVLSPRTAAKDQRPKRDLYERHGVGEYWLVHPTDQVLFIYRLADGRYGKPDVRPALGETPVATLPGLVIQWASVFPQEEPRVQSPRT
jgi:Uma2 family endonuclease